MEIKLSRKRDKNGIKLDAQQISMCIKRYEEGESVYAISKELKISDGLIAAALKRNGISLFLKNTRHVSTFNRYADLVTDYQNGCSLGALVGKYNISANVIKKWLVHDNLWTAPKNQKIQMTETALQCAIELANNGTAHHIIAKQLGYSVWVIQQSVYAAGVRRKKPKRPFSSYKDLVRALSNENYQQFKSIINPSNLPRGKLQYHLDHIYSIRAAYENNVDISIVAHPANLQLLHYKNNISKKHRCDQTLDTLMEKVTNFGQA
jgi:hypothetical protein